MIKKLKTKVFNRVHDWFFGRVHGNRLIYNTCWEDPRIDRELMQLNTESKVVMITSAGCNALDYALDSPAEIHAIDVNPRQNALLQLKLSLIKHGSYEDLYSMFGVGSHRSYRTLYQSLKSWLPKYAQEFWNEKVYYFDTKGIKKSFYYHGASGDIAWILKEYIMRTSKTIRDCVNDLLDAATLEEQRQIYSRIEPEVWGRFSTWFVRQPAVMAMVGVPRPQIRLIEAGYPGGLLGFVKDSFKGVLTEVPMRDNYFWRVYITGSYSETCAPSYVKAENFETLRRNAKHIHNYTCTISDFLKRHPGTYTHYVLLDHQDWLAWHAPEALAEEWELILKNSQPGTKILMRSAGLDASFLPKFATEALRFFPERTEPLHKRDRVGTYGSMHFAEVK